MSKTVARIGMCVSLAMIFSYIEVLIPFHFGIPGVKLGLANIVIVIGLFFLEIREVFLISIVRILLMGLLFGNGASLLYSLAGGFLSLAGMFLLKRIQKFSVTGISVAGGVLHNVGQILMAAILMESGSILYYLPVLLAAGVVTGLLIGLLSAKVITAAQKADAVTRY